MGWVNRVVLGLAGFPRLNHEVTAVPVKTGAVQHVVHPGYQVVPVGHQPVFVIADEKVGVGHAKEAAGHTLASAEAIADGFQKLLLPVLFGQHVLVRPRFPIGHGLSPRSAGDALSQVCAHFFDRFDCDKLRIVTAELFILPIDFELLLWPARKVFTIRNVSAPCVGIGLAGSMVAVVRCL